MNRADEDQQALASKLGLPFSDLLIPPLKMIFASAIMGVFLWVPMRFLDRFVFDTTRVISLVLLTVIAGLIGLLVYLGLSYLFRLTQLDAFLSLLRRIGNWQQVLKDTDEVIEPASPAQELKPA